MPLLSLLSDLLLIGATLGLATWCLRISRRLGSAPATAAISNDGNADAIADLSRLAAALRKDLDAVQQSSEERVDRLAATNIAADDRIGRMEMLLASLEDFENDGADRLTGTSDSTKRTAANNGSDAVPSFRASRPAAGGRNR